MLYFYSVIILMFTSVLYISKLSNYTYIGQSDFQMYLWLSTLRINVSQINTLYNIAIIIYLFASLYFLTLISRFSWKAVLPVFTVIGGFFIYTNSHSFIWILYTKINDPNSAGNFYRSVSNIIYSIDAGIIACAVALPFIHLLLYYMNTKIYVKKKNAITYAVCIGIVDIYMLYMFSTGAFPPIAGKNIETLGMPEFIPENNIFMASPAFVFVLVVFIIFVILYFKPFNLYVLVRRHEISRNSISINKNIRMILHVYKNAFIGIEKKTEMAQALLKSSETELVSKQLSDIGFLADESILRIERMLNVLREPSMYYEITNLSSCLMSALSKVGVPENVRIHYGGIPQNIAVFASAEHITEVFVNIIINAIEAIERKKPEHGYIDITVIDEDDAIAINFQDNGCGIPRNNYRDIYKPFFSTKNTTDCGGVGLDYVKRIVKSHHGDVYVKSKVGVYTLFQVVLPALKKEKIYG